VLAVCVGDGGVEGFQLRFVDVGFVEVVHWDQAALGHVLALRKLGDSTAQSILTADTLLADRDRVLGAGHPETLSTRGNLANVYQAACRTAEDPGVYQQPGRMVDRTDL
jgi:hypothetical protein